MDNVEKQLLDPDVMEMVEFFNNYGLKTDSSCSGHKGNPGQHKFYIMFKKCVDDNCIRDFISLFDQPLYGVKNNKVLRGRFLKVNYGLNGIGEWDERWRYEVDTSTDPELNIMYAHRDLGLFREVVERCN